MTSDTNTQRLYRRLVRRSLHRSRSSAVIVTFALGSLVLAWVATESVLAAVDAPALLLSPASIAEAVNTPTMLTIAVAAVMAVVGVVLVALAITPGRRARHEIPDARMAVVIDDGVLAGALSKAAIRESRVAASRVSTVVSRRQSSVTITPTSGSLLSAPSITHAVRAVVESLAPRPALRVAVAVSERGVVGS